MHVDQGHYLRDINLQDWIRGLSDEEMPKEFRDYTAHLIERFEDAMINLPHHAKPALSASRNKVIRTAIYAVARTFNLNPTRSLDSKTEECGCSIVSKALERLNIDLSEETILKEVLPEQRAARRPRRRAEHQPKRRPMTEQRK